MIQNGMAVGAMAELDRQERQGKAFARLLADAEDDLRAGCARSLDAAEKFCLDHVADAYGELAKVYRMACSALLSDQELGRMIRETVTGPTLRLVAEYAAEKREGFES